MTDEPLPRRGFKLLNEQVGDLRELSANPRQRTPTGIQQLDDLIWGPALGEVFTFIGRSGIGKSLVATNIIANNPESHTLFFSLEMPSHMCLMRLWAHVNDRSHDEIFNLVHSNRMPDQVSDLVNALPFTVVVDEPALSLDSMAHYITRYAEHFGFRPDIVIIDYLEEIGGAKASGEGWTRTEATASALKAWARKEKVGVYALHQANMKTEPYEPIIQSSAKGGGFTEADVVVGMWKPGKDPDLSHGVREQRQHDLFMNILKNRITGHLTDEVQFLISPSMLIHPLIQQPTLVSSR